MRHAILIFCLLLLVMVGFVCTASIKIGPEVKIAEDRYARRLEEQKKIDSRMKECR